MRRASGCSWAPVIAGMILCAGLLVGCGGSDGSSDPASSDPPNVAPVENSAVTLAWQPPSENTDGSALTDLNGYVINYGTQSGQLTSSITLTNPGLTEYVVDNLSPGTYYFSITATASDGTQSAPSPVVTASVD
jgi:Tfp pilus assembly protein PilX